MGKHEETLVDPLTGNEVQADDVYEREHGNDWLNRDEELRDVTLSEYDDARCEEKYGDSSDDCCDIY